MVFACPFMEIASLGMKNSLSRLDEINANFLAALATDCDRCLCNYNDRLYN